jgi:hypothetical protein
VAEAFTGFPPSGIDFLALPARPPRGDLLRCDSLHASVQRAHPPTLASPAFADTLAGLLTPFAQLHHWLVDHVTA